MSLLSYYNCDGELPLHVVCLFWNMVPSRVKWFILILVPRYTRSWLLLLVARRFGRHIWLGVRSIRFIVVIVCDGPVTMAFRNWNVCHGISSIIGYSSYVMFSD